MGTIMIMQPQKVLLGKSNGHQKYLENNYFASFLNVCTEGAL
jgi:hypothetical protein